MDALFRDIRYALRSWRRAPGPIVAALAANESLTFAELKDVLKTSDGNLSVHARRLEEAVAELRTLPEDEQDRAAATLLAFTRDRRITRSLWSRSRAFNTLWARPTGESSQATNVCARFSAARYEHPRHRRRGR